MCIVAWDGIPKPEADSAYKLLVHKLNKFGLPTTRRCATNENRTCACQGMYIVFETLRKFILYMISVIFRVCSLLFNRV